MDMSQHALPIAEIMRRYPDQWVLVEETASQGRTFLLAYLYPGQSPHSKEQIVEMAMHASRIRDTALVLHVSPTTVIKERKTRRLCCTR